MSYILQYIILSIHAQNKGIIIVLNVTVIKINAFRIKKIIITTTSLITVLMACLF